MKNSIAIDINADMGESFRPAPQPHQCCRASLAHTERAEGPVSL
jgi:hypothetical protein